MGIDAIAGYMKNFGFGAQDRHRPAGRGARRAALAGVEDEALPPARAAEMVSRRDHLDRHRPGLQLLHADPARAGDGDARQRRHACTGRASWPTSTTRAPASAGASSPRWCSRVPAKPEHIEFVKRAMAGVNKEGTGARAFAGAQYTSGGKTGTAQVIAMKQNEKYDEKKVAERHRDHSWFIAFAPLESPKIALADHRRERRLRRARRGADRAHHARLLPARQGARGHAAADARGRSRGRGTGERLMELARVPAAPHRLASGRGHRFHAARDPAHALDGRPRGAVLGELRGARPGAAQLVNLVVALTRDVGRGAGAAADHDALRGAGLRGRPGLLDRGGACSATW